MTVFTLNSADTTYNIDQGSYSSFAETGTAGTYRITPYKHWNSTWAWWAFRTAKLAGTTPIFVTAVADHYGMYAGERLCCWATSDDTDTWNDFDNVTIGGTDLEFSMDTPFPYGMIYISALPMYPFSRTQRKMAEWLAHDYVSDTTSSTSGVIGTATPRITIDGRTSTALPFYGFKITGNRVGDKNKAILSAGNHPSETPGPYQLEGAVIWLLGGTAEAETLLDYFEFYVYPCLNPQGVYGGYFRSSPQTPTSDNNRLWDGTGVNEAVDAFKTAMTADTGGTIAVGFDYHSFMSAGNIFGSVHTGDTTGLYEYFRIEMAALDSDYDLVGSTISDSLRYYLFRQTFSAGLAISQEQQGEIARGVPDYLVYGANSMRAIYEMLIDERFTYHP